MLDFARILKEFMEVRRISGQKIADAVGVSQKTISRYARGESEPSDEMQWKIFKAIAEIGGHPEDANIPLALRPDESLDESISLLADLEFEILETGCEGLRWPDKFYTEASAVFSLLKEDNQKFVLDHLEAYASVRCYEIDIIHSFTLLSEAQKDFVLKSLQTIHLDYREMSTKPAICKKISNCMRMISECESIVPESWKLGVADVPESPADTELVKKYKDLLMESYEDEVPMLCLFLREMLFWDERDWYLLMLVNFLVLSDQGLNMTEGKEILGDKVFGLTKYLEEQKEKIIEKYKKEGLENEKKQKP